MCPQIRRPEAAFTLYELLMTLALVAVVVAVGLPSFGSLLANSRLRAESNALFDSIYLARKESVVRRRAVTLCPSQDGLSCDTANDWSSGWIRFVNTDRDDPPVRDADEAILHYHAVEPGVVIAANRRGFTLRSTELRATNGTLVVCDAAGRAESRAVVVSYTGRPRVTRRDSAGRPYSCAH